MCLGHLIISKITVTVLLTEQLSMFEFACAMELFALPRKDFNEWYETRVVSLSKPTYQSLANTYLNCDLEPRLPKCDLLVIPSYPVIHKEKNAELIKQLIEHHKSGGRTISFCSGAFLLAEAGLLQSRIATTHWMYSTLFKEQFPTIEYKEDILYEYDGVIGCSAGSAAGIDLGIEVIRQDFGHDIANKVARRLVLPAHRNGGQSQFIEKPLAYDSTVISKTMEWASKNLSPELTIEVLARKANMTRRTFDRNFKKLYRITPLQWLTEQKLENAKRLLETSQLSIDKLATESGFDNAITLRQNFKKYISISPTEYRAKFRR